MEKDLINQINISSLQEAEDILKGAGTEDLFEKAKHQDGDMHPNGKWVWVSSANGGKGDWRTKGGRTHTKHNAGGNVGTGSATTTQQKPTTQVVGTTKKITSDKEFLDTFRDASDDVLNKIVSGKIQASDREKKLVQQIIDERKKPKVGDVSKLTAQQKSMVDKVMDKGFLMTSSKYNDKSKIELKKTDKGNWRCYYDGKDIGVTIAGSTITDSAAKKIGWYKEEVEANTARATPGMKDYAKFSESLIQHYSQKKYFDNVSLSDIEEDFITHLKDQSKNPSASSYMNAAKEVYHEIMNKHKEMKGKKEDVVETSKVGDVSKLTAQQKSMVDKVMDKGFLIVSSKYNDKSKIELKKTLMGNWRCYYDGRDVGIISGKLISDTAAKKIGWYKEETKSTTTEPTSSTSTNDFANISKEDAKKFIGKKIKVTDTLSNKTYETTIDGIEDVYLQKNKASVGIAFKNEKGAKIYYQIKLVNSGKPSKSGLKIDLKTTNI